MPFQKLSQINLTIKGKAEAGPTLLFIHGAGMDKSVWEKQQALQEQGFQLAFIDLPEHGKSKGTAAESIEDMAADIINLIEQSKFESVCLVGHSMGALIAFIAAASNSSKIKAACLCGVSNKMPVHPDLLNMAKENDPAAAKMIAKWSFGSALPEEDRINHIEQSRKLVENAAPGILHNDLKACNDFEDALEICPHVNKPVLLLLGEEDKMTPVKGAAKLDDALPISKQVILPQAGHMMMQEAPEAFNSALADFAKKVA